MARSVLDEPCSLNEYGSDHFDEPDYSTSCSTCDEDRTEDDMTCEEIECECDCHVTPSEPEEPEDGS